MFIRALLLDKMHQMAKPWPEITIPMKIPAIPNIYLPPANAWERAGNSLRRVSRFLASVQSVFGFFAAAASFSRYPGIPAPNAGFLLPTAPDLGSYRHRY